MVDALRSIFDKLWNACERSGAYGRTVTLKLKYADFQQLTRSQSFKAPVASRAELERISLGLLAPLCPAARGVRLLGVTVSSLTSKEDEPARVEQMSLAL
jgi:DNA polymerase-4